MASKMTRSISTKRLTAIINVARKHGLKRLKVGDVEFDLSPISHSSNKVDSNKVEIDSDSERMPTEDELLLMSTPFYDDARLARDQAKLPET